METKICKCCGRELPIEDFSRNHFGPTSVCKDCNHNNRSKARMNYVARKKANEPSIEQQVEQAKNMRLEEFTPRELILELKRRGYTGKLTYTQIRVLDIETLE